MIKFVTSLVLSLFKPTDISISLNGSSILFTKEGDVKITASRSLIENGKYVFTNCTEEQISYILYSKETECLQQLEEETL
jgi:hypothetical protein